ncbi:acetylglutamate kinase [Aneurinibacillus aneurinilyticus]|uniref:Acetylglutamate kinase n=2 Tax=Aneurinibacillus aneurinilyticus TaxID=1391 RepID=A0A848CY09_ANEAE|nr:acetylglutamate kinase [Aneurinibacillus aneurinilyticus]ERI04518.1 acetylglutamate kinase [Aneurinibacillus aneurinilyticus ATCC 12856]MED0706478.1 acetylglutamate kinase [Aneurinibacillus aneurinilyticus]MED0721401.1 acetylglutamate kinase [Aneurinibacillus aneurinilyticus]MED0731127.1 acetylglutamate kinase [Aneurinibacillus aneurinilyticus]MED0743259.1 acetylglutamate kinase [Aneurinibacillus aneurinilyticus]
MENQVVIKCGGSTLEGLPASFYTDIKELQDEGTAVTIVHGGGPAISATLKQMGIEPQFVDGLRVTDAATLQVAQMVLIGQTNKQIVSRIQAAGGRAAGISGIDGATIQVVQGPAHLGFVGDIHCVHGELIAALGDAGFIPVIAPLGIDGDGQIYNINADTAAGAVAGAAGTKRLIMVTDVPGVMQEKDGVRQVLPELDKEKIAELIADGIIYGGMIPKVRAALDALGNNVEEVWIINGYEPGILKKVAAGEAVGTKIVKEGKVNAQ